MYPVAAKYFFDNDDYYSWIYEVGCRPAGASTLLREFAKSRVRDESRHVEFVCFVGEKDNKGKGKNNEEEKEVGIAKKVEYVLDKSFDRLKTNIELSLAVHAFNTEYEEVASDSPDYGIDGRLPFLSDSAEESLKWAIIRSLVLIYINMYGDEVRRKNVLRKKESGRDLRRTENFLELE